jgi:outer membrane protein assembly factor BamB
LVQLLGVVPAALLLSGLLIVAVAPAAPAAAAAAANGDWPQFQHGPTHDGYNSQETILSASNVQNLGVAWTGATDESLASPAVVADGMVYVGSTVGELYAYAVGCASFGGTCTPLWTGTVGYMRGLSPAVADGVVYVPGDDFKVSAFAVGCASGGGTCLPLWTGTTGDSATSSPVVADGVVYVGGGNGKLYAFAVGCNSGGGTCSPLWTATTGGWMMSSPAVANGVVYVRTDKLYAYAVGCASHGGTCKPLWTASTGGGNSSPVVSNGIVYAASQDGKLYAFAVGCASGGGTCKPLWTGATGDWIGSSPAVANGVVYVVSSDGHLYAFAVGCASGGGTCTPLWTAKTARYSLYPPVVANGVVYLGFQDYYPGTGQPSEIEAFAVGCAGGGGTCTPLWTSTTPGGLTVVANGALYVVGDGTLYALGLPGATYHALTPARVLDSRTKLGGGLFHSQVKQTLTVATTASGVPKSAVAVTGNLTIVGQTHAGYVAVAPSLISGKQPPTSTINFPVGDTRANGITVPLASGGKLDLMYWSASKADKVNVIFDVTGYFAIDATGSRYHALTPARVLDSRTKRGLSLFHSQVRQTLSVATAASGVPSSAVAVTGNVTVVGQTRGGYVTVAPHLTSGVQPPTSTINFPLGDVRANGMTVPLASGGKLDLMYWSSKTTDTTNLIFDVTGYFSPGATGATYHGLTPARVLDSRPGAAHIGAAVFHSRTKQTFLVATAASGVPSNAVAVTGNVTVVGQTHAGYVTVAPHLTSGVQPPTSTINFPLGDTRANGMTVPLATGGKLDLMYWNSATTDKVNVIFDVTGYFS